MKITRLLFYLFLMVSVGTMVSCGDDDDPTPSDDMMDPGDDDGEEFIDEVILTFTPQQSGKDVVTARWFDADGDGVGSGEVTQGIALEEGVTYDLSFRLNNTVADENVTLEIAEEDAEHQFFFEFTENIFSDPTGNGNIDNKDDPINYNDQDANGLPVGLATTWTAGGHTDATGNFRVLLKHQPELKNADSDATTGGTDIDITFPLDIEEDANLEEEFIDEVILTFTPQQTGKEIVEARWFDADGDGVGSGEVTAPIALEEGITYDLAVTLTNTVESEDVTAEILEEDDEHQFFFAFSEGYFSDPTGDGNIDNRDDAINYTDQDDNGLPVGLSTVWTAGDPSTTSGTFRIVLKHQPDQKSATSDASTGGTDIDIEFPIDIEEDPNIEEEFIDQVMLTFTPTAGGDDVVVTWFDPDGEGVANGTTDGPINLTSGVEYDLAITLTNTVEDEDITAEILDEDDEHQFFFEFTADIFSDPTGDGNVDNRDDAVNYNDQDDNGLPVGLSTRWTAGSPTTSNGTFRVILKHQPDQKSATSDSSVGGTDIDIPVDININ
ncbi:MAG: hypothetical protein AAGC88_00575 [Bacteroidota bacterium]